VEIWQKNGIQFEVPGGTSGFYKSLQHHTDGQIKQDHSVQY